MQNPYLDLPNFQTYAVVVFDQASTRLPFGMRGRFGRLSLYIPAFHVPVIRSVLVYGKSQEIVSIIT